ncbi:MAG: DUF192 domain-containing protein [Candidatus Dormibacteraceae bacterium]
MRKPDRKLVQADTGKILADRLERPRTFIGRGTGLMLRPPLEPGQGMLIEPCNGIHMLFMRSAIDALFLDRRDRVKKVYRRVPPWYGVVWIVFGAAKVVELPPGSLDGLDLPPGEQMEILPL